MDDVLEPEAALMHGQKGTCHEDVGSQVTRLSQPMWEDLNSNIRKKTKEKPTLLAVPPIEDWADASLGCSWAHPFAAAEPDHDFRVFQESLRSLTAMEFSILGLATSETSTRMSWEKAIQVRRRGGESNKGPREEKWTDGKNRRRCELVDKEIDDTLSEGEQQELKELQAEMLVYRRKVAPLPIDSLRELHQELLREATDR